VRLRLRRVVALQIVSFQEPLNRDSVLKKLPCCLAVGGAQDAGDPLDFAREVVIQANVQHVAKRLLGRFLRLFAACHTPIVAYNKSSVKCVLHAWSTKSSLLHPCPHALAFGRVRIEALQVANFRGIESAQLDGLSASSLVTVAGPNGAGKSVLFEAIALLWRIISIWQRQQLVPANIIGPWGDTAAIAVAVVLSDDEMAALGEYSARAGLPEPQSTRAEMELQIVYGDNPVFFNVAKWASPLWTLDFTTRHVFANVDFFPADRAFPRGEHAAVNPALLSEQQREAFRDQIVGSFTQQRQLVSLSGIAPLLASLDYVDLLAQREGRESSGDFDALADAFAAATSKILLRPTLDPTSPHGSVLRVQTPAGVLHGIDQLSSGEQEVLGLMYFVRRLNARGGVLLIDEPELHLHPSLQRALFATLEATAARSQVWIATHSARLISAAPLDAIIHIVPAAGNATNQLRRASDEGDRLRVIEDLGVHPIEAFQSDAFVVVEGTTDEQRLSTLLPLEFGRVFTFVAGSATEVESVVKMLNYDPLPIPHVGIRDRDYLTDGQAQALEADIPNLFIWSSRSIENEILYPPLIVKTFERIGRAATEDEVIAELRRLADAQRELVQAALVEERLRERHAYTRAGATALEKQRHYLQEVGRVADEKLADLEAVATEVDQDLGASWDEAFLRLADGKRMLSEFVEFTGFRSLRDFLSAMTQTVHDHPELLPPAFGRLRDRLRDVLPAAPQP
jgi:predicted ATPase